MFLLGFLLIRFLLSSIPVGFLSSCYLLPWLVVHLVVCCCVVFLVFLLLRCCCCCCVVFYILVVSFFHSCEHACSVMMFFSPSGFLFLSWFLVVFLFSVVVWLFVLVGCIAWVVPSGVVLLVLRGAAQKKCHKKWKKSKRGGGGVSAKNKKTTIRYCFSKGPMGATNLRGVIKFQIFPKFTIVYISLGGWGSRK